MLRLRAMLLLITALFPLISFKAGPAQFVVKNHVKWVLTKASSLKVNGKTNINKFSCLIPEYTTPDTLILSRQKDAELIKLSGSMILEVRNFDCHNPMMTADLRKTLKAKDFPKITITFISLSKYPDSNNESIKGGVNIQLAGVTKYFEVSYQFVPAKDETLTLIGTKAVNFSDFDIIPPRKLGGMIKTNNELSVEFILKARILK